MKKLKIIGTMMLGGSLLLSGCGNIGDSADEPGTEDALIINESNKEGGSIETGEGYGFTQFDLEIDVDGEKTIDIDYDAEEEEFKAEYENTLNKIKLEDKEAIDELHLLFMDIRLTNETTEEEAKTKILEWFEIESYSKFDLKADFDDGTTLTVQDSQ